MVVLINSCTKETNEKYENLQEYVDLYEVDDNNDVISCAASSKDNSGNVFVFFYPIPEATNFRYFESDNTKVDKNNWRQYSEVELEIENVFNGYLKRFVRPVSNDSFCVVTYLVDGVLRTSQPITLKNELKPTEWIQDVDIDLTQNVNPKFSWTDGSIDENEIYFQVITDEQNNLLSGTYTYEKEFTYYDLSNVVLNVTREEPPFLLLNNSYSFTMMGVSIDNWVNLVIQKGFQTTK